MNPRELQAYSPFCLLMRFESCQVVVASLGLSTLASRHWRDSQSILELRAMAVEAIGLIWCLDWVIGRFMLQSAGPSLSCPEGVLHGGLEESGIGLRLRKGLGFWRL